MKYIDYISLAFTRENETGRIPRQEFIRNRACKTESLFHMFKLRMVCVCVPHWYVALKSENVLYTDIFSAHQSWSRVSVPHYQWCIRQNWCLISHFPSMSKLIKHTSSWTMNSRIWGSEHNTSTNYIYRSHIVIIYCTLITILSIQLRLKWILYDKD